MKTAKAPSGKALAVSSQKSNDKQLASEVNVVSSDKGKEPRQPRGKKKGKNEKKKQGDSTPEKYFGNPARQRKPNQPYFICNEDHFTRDCQHQAKVAKFLKTSTTSAVLTDPFPNPETNLVAINNASPSKVLMLSISKQQNDALISTRNKDYGNPQMLNNKAIDQPNSSTTTSSDVVPPIIPELTINPPKGAVHKSTFNPHARAA